MIVINRSNNEIKLNAESSVDIKCQNRWTLIERVASSAAVKVAHEIANFGH